MAYRVELRERAAADIHEAVEHYRGEGGDPLALRFVDAIERAVARIGRTPRIGALRFSDELDIPGLRTRAVARFPYLVFYVVDNDRVDVWRVLHSRRDIPPAVTEILE